MNMSIKGILFDMDGVLVDSENYSLQKFEEAARSVGKTFGTDLFTMIMGRIAGTSMDVISERLGKENADKVYDWIAAREADKFKGEDNNVENY